MVGSNSIWLGVTLKVGSSLDSFGKTSSDGV